MPQDLVSDAAMGEKNTHFRSQKQVRHYRAAATNTSTKTTTVVPGKRKKKKKETVNKRQLQVIHWGCT